MTQKALLQSAGDGTAVPSGYVGEKIIASQSSGTFAQSTNANQWYDLLSTPITKGIWDVYIFVSGIGGSILTNSFVGAGLTSGNTSPGTAGVNYFVTNIATASAPAFISTPPMRITPSVDGTLYLKWMCSTAQGSAVINGIVSIQAIRIS